MLISILCPFYNEEESISAFFAAVTSVMEASGYDFEIVCVNDGSSDRTLDLLIEKAYADNRVHVIDFSRNFGKEAALTAAIDHAKGEAVIPIDTDLQDPPELIPVLISRHIDGFDVVLARRVDRSTDSFLKRLTAQMFYKLHNKISKPAIPYNVGDFRLMSRDVVDAVKQLPEKQRFMKGIFAWVGFKTCYVDYVRCVRSAGLTKFNGWRLWNFALEGITSFSTFPLTIWLYVGIFTAICSFAYGLYIFARTIIMGIDQPGYASIICLILFFGGLNLTGIGIIGEYLGRTYMESKDRPLYVVRKIY